MPAAEGFDDILRRPGQAVAETRSMPRTVGHARVPTGDWDPAVAVGHLREGFWPVAGAVLVNLRNILDALDVVADAQPVEVLRPTLRPALRHSPNGPTASGASAKANKQSTHRPA